MPGASWPDGARSLGGRLLRRGYTERARQVAQSLYTGLGLQILLFGSGLIVARSLGPAGRGDIAIILILPTVAAQVVCLGVPSAATYFTARHVPDWRFIVRHLRLSIAIQSAVAVLAVLALNAAFLGNAGDSARTAGMLVVGAVPLLIVQFYVLAVLLGIGDLRWWNICRVVPFAAYTMGLVACLFFGMTVVVCAALWCVSQLLAAAVLLARGWVHHKRRPTPSATATALPTRHEVVRFGVVGFLAQVSPVETFRLDALLVAALFPSQVIGYYAIAFSVSNLPRFVADSVVSVGYPHVARESGASARALARRYVLMAAVLCGGTAVAVAVALPWLIPVLFGASFRPAIEVSVILVLAIGVISTRRVGSDCLRALGRPRDSTLIEVATLIALVACVVMFGDWPNGEGIALSLGLSGAFGLVVTLLVLRRGPRTPA